MRKRVEMFVREKGLFGVGEKILVGLSGGADSVCLLHLLVSMREEWGLEIRAVHVNHQLRGEEAKRDEEFAVRLCEEFGVCCVCRRAEVAEFSRRNGSSLEEAGRILRYRIFEEEAKAWEGETEGKERRVRVAVAHHGDDNVETVLFHLFRGSGLKGLGGIPAVRGRLIRPLLVVSRREILEYLKEQGVGFCEDSTNGMTDYTRNRIRHNVLPLIEEEINCRAARHVLQAAERVSQADAYLEGEAKRWLGEYGRREKGEERVWRVGVDAGVLCGEAQIIQTYVIREMMGEMAGAKKDLTSVHVEDVRRLLGKQAGKRVDLPYGLTARRTYDGLWIERGGEGGRENQEGISAPEMEMRVFSYEKGMEIPQNQYTKWFDYDTIKGTLSVRTRQTGDFFYLPGGGRKTIKAYMVDEKIPVQERAGLWLVADGNHILWIIGRRISEGCKVTEKTKRILQVHISKGEENG